MSGQILSSVIGAIAVVLLGFIARTIGHLGNDMRRFMTEHLWLLSTTLWTRDKVMKIMDHLGMHVDDEPPSDLPPKRLQRSASGPGNF